VGSSDRERERRQGREMSESESQALKSDRCEELQRVAWPAGSVEARVRDDECEG